MQWWGNLGSLLSGIAVLIAAIFAVIYAITKRQGPAWLQAVQDREHAQAEAAREQADLAREQAAQIRLDRRRRLYGWSSHGIHTFTVALVTDPAEMDQAQQELAPGNTPSSYVVLRVAESSEKNGNVNRAHDLRQIIETERLISRAPTLGEREALETGLGAMGITRA